MDHSSRLFALFVVLSATTSASAQATPAPACSRDGFCEVMRAPSRRAWFGPIWGTGPNDVFAGGRGVLAHFDGRAWTVTPDHSESGIFAIEGSGPDDVYAVGSMRTIQRWNGHRWVLELEDEAAGLRAGSLQWLAVVGPGDAWAFDTQAWHRVDGRWQRQERRRGTPDDPYVHLFASAPRRPPSGCHGATYTQLGRRAFVVACRDGAVFVSEDGVDRPLFRRPRDVRRPLDAIPIGDDRIAVLFSSGHVMMNGTPEMPVLSLGTGRIDAGRLYFDGESLYVTTGRSILRKRLEPTLANVSHDSH